MINEGEGNWSISEIGRLYEDASPEGGKNAGLTPNECGDLTLVGKLHLQQSLNTVSTDSFCCMQLPRLLPSESCKPSLE